MKPNKPNELRFFGVETGETILRKYLDWEIRNNIRYKERKLGYKCKRIWWQINRFGEIFLFGHFADIDNDWIPVTLAHYNGEWVVDELYRVD